MKKHRKGARGKSRERRYREGIRHAHEQVDFVRRNIRPQMPYLAIGAATGFAILTLAILQMDIIGGSPTLITVVACEFLLVVVWMTITLDRMRDLVFSSEFEMALLAGAAGTGAQFLVIAKRNRQVIYVNPGFRTMFPDTKEPAMHNFSDMLDATGMEAEVRDRLLLSLISREAFESFSSVKPHRQPRRMMHLQVDPIARPGGFVVLRGFKMSREERTGQTMATEDIIPSVGHLFEAMPCGVYKVSAEGELLYANPALEAMLRYREDELLAHRTRFEELLYVGFRDSALNQPWAGAIAFLDKEGAPVRLRLKQVIVPGEAGQEPVRVGFVMPAERSTERKE